MKTRKLHVLNRNRYFLKSLSVICAVVIAASPVSLAAGSRKIENQESGLHNVTLTKNTSTAQTAIKEEYKAVKKLPDSKAIEILEKTQSSDKADAEKANKDETKKSKPVNNIMQSSKAVSLLKTETLDTSKSAPNPLDSVIAFFKIYNNGINNFTMYTVDRGGNLSEFVAEYDDNNGGHHTAYSGVYYDKANNLIYGKDDTGVFAIGFNLDIGQHMIYSANSSWQKDMGFCKLYDALAPVIFEKYLTTRVNFQYDGKDWLIQLWKGIYVVTMGAEIGIYNKPQDRAVEFYDCLGNSDLITMSMRLLKGNQVLFARAMQSSWWLTGFQFTQLCQPSQLTLESTIVFQNTEMKVAFTSALDKQHAGEINYTADGNAVSLIW